MTCKRCAEGKAMYCVSCLDELMGEKDKAETLVKDMMDTCNNCAWKDRARRAEKVIEAARELLKKGCVRGSQEHLGLEEAMQTYDEAVKP
jgi:hypothetical protein